MSHFSRPFRALSGVASAALVLSGFSLLVAAPASAIDGPPVQSVVYDSIPETLPGNYPSLGFEARATTEYGDYVQLGDGSRVLESVTVGLSSWACESGQWSTGDCETTAGATFEHPITLNVYEVDNSGSEPAAGPLIASVTETITVPYRPSPSPDECGESAPQWYHADSGKCVTGIATNASFDFTGDVIVLSSDVIIGVAMNTRTYGADPIGVTGPYDSLNVSLVDADPTIGTDENRDVIFFARSGDTFAPAAGWSDYFGLGLEIHTNDALLGAPTAAVTVGKDDVKLSETPETYLSWHEGRSGQEANPGFDVKHDGLHLGTVNSSTLIKGVDATASEVTEEDLRELIARASAEVASGAITFQIPVHFGDNGSHPMAGGNFFTTLRTSILGAGTLGFDLDQTWATTRAWGGYAAQSSHELGDMIDRMFESYDHVWLAGFGVQADKGANAVVTSVTWDDTKYTFFEAGVLVEGTVAIIGDPKVGVELTADASAWEPAPVALAYQWNADGVAITGATGATYTPVAADLGAKLSVTVTGTKPGYTTASVTSAETAAVVNGEVTVDRLAGSNRYGTAVEISKSQFPSGADMVYIANGRGYPDALSAAPAAAHNNAPLLLTEHGALPAVIKAELERLQPDEIIIAGGTGVVSAAVETQLKKLSFAPEVRRVAGTNRYGTSIALARDAFGPGSVDTAYLASGLDFPDALSASPAAAHFDGPVILVQGTAKNVSAATLAVLDDLGVDAVKLAGGTGVVSTGIQSQLNAKFGASNVTRNGGSNRYMTAVAINADAFGSSSTVYLANGLGFADALAGAAVAGINDAPLYITPANCVPVQVASAITALGATKVVLLGGTGVLTAAVGNLTVCK